ncbi:WD40 repeat domain-containing protein [Yinghuangia soli]|uniref:WD40 repeat domain-containing protein n=1 Tax=Yinghuangia soli TaxID=2908204 RepID=A0AA41U3H7_9ACTN|nr:WD40 repeat domain-containing protein [Yinghuangia soli]MCF2531826.1 WD40 repeat domain-containing protein [Yinghuangia soli]
MQRTDEPPTVLLTRHDSPLPKHWRLTRDGTRITRESWTGAGKPRSTSRHIDGPPAAAAQEFRKQVRRKMHEGFAVLRVPDAARPGDLLLECTVPNRYVSSAFDLRPDGAEVAVATSLRDGSGAEIHLIDVATGVRRPVHTEPAAGPHGTRAYTVLHALGYDSTGTALVFALDGETRRLDLRTGEIRVLASYRHLHDAHFNPYRLEPEWDASRTRLLVFDTGDTVRIQDADGTALFALPVADPVTGPATECRAAALSPSGRLLALYRPSHGSMHRYGDAIEVWDVDTGTLRSRIQVPAPYPDNRLDRIGFDPDEKLIVANIEPAQGPFAFSAETGELAWHTPAATRTEPDDPCFTWAYAPDGSLLAIGRQRADRGIDLRDATTREPAPITLERIEGHRVRRLVFSADSRILAAGGDSDLLTVRKIR